MKVLSIILGALLVVSGFYCMLTPVATYSALGAIIGATMLAEGIASIILWANLRKTELANGWLLAGGIVSVLLGVFLLGSYALQFSVDLFIAYIIAFWLVVAGIVRIVTAVNGRNSQAATGSGNRWILQVVLGVLIVILGILSIFNPVSIMASVGLMLGMSIVFLGASLIISSFDM